MINYIGIAILFFFLVFVFLKKEKRLSDYFLILINLLIAGFLGLDLWVKNGLNPLNFCLQTISSYLLLPIFLTYGLLLMEDRKALRRNVWWYSSFAVLACLFVFLDFTVWSDYHEEGLQTLYEYPPLQYHIMYKGSHVFVMVSLLWFRGLYKRYRSQIREQFSFIEPIRLSWLQIFYWVYLSINLLTLMMFLSYNLGLIGNVEIPYQILNIVLVAAVFYLSFNGIRQYSAAEYYRVNSGASLTSGAGPDAEQGTHEISPKDSVEIETEQVLTPQESNGKKYQTSSLTEAERDRLYQQLRTMFEEEQVFLEPKLQVQDVAQRMGVSKYKISQTLNEAAGKPFYEFVNSYRVEHFKTQLLASKNKQFTILAIGLDSGFNSKASLNRIFRQATGQSPSEFRKASS